MTTTLNKSYLQFINELKDQIKTARVKAHLAVNRELVLLYFRIGKSILEKQKEEGWGAKIIERISCDLKFEFPEMTGLSRANLFFMRKFAEIIQQFHKENLGDKIVYQAGGQLENMPLFNIPWRHNVVLLEESFSAEQRLWYASQTIKNGLKKLLIKRLGKLFQVLMKLKISNKY